jgi:hypothetical protein
MAEQELFLASQDPLSSMLAVEGALERLLELVVEAVVVTVRLVM